MIKHSLSSIEKEIKKLKEEILPESICIAFLESTDNPCIFKICENVYRSRAAPVHTVREVTAATFEEAAEQYRFPEGCDQEKSILFMYDFGKIE